MKPTLLVINYTSDISGSSVSLFRMLASINEKVSFLLVTHPESYMSQKAKSCRWEYREIPLPLMVRIWSPVYWLCYLWDCVMAGRQVKKLIDSSHPKHILVNCISNVGWLWGWMRVRRELRPDLLWLVHELKLEPGWVFYLMRKLVQLLSKKILCVSTSVQQLFTGDTLLMPNIVPAVHNIVYSNPFQQGDLRLLWVGTVSPRKGLHHMPSVLQAFLNLSIPLKLEIVASVSPKYRNYFNTCLKLLAKIDIQVETRVNCKESLPYYTSSKILLHTSLQPESFSLVSMEAMSRGMLVFASHKGGIKDYGVHMQNLIFFEELQQPLGDCLEMLKGNPEKVVEIQKNAHETAKGYFPEKLTPLLLEVLS